MSDSQMLGWRETADNGETREKGQKNRGGTRCISAHLPEDTYWRLKQIAATQRIEMKEVIAEAANALFEKYDSK